MNEITITVSGPAGSGRTTLVEAIRRLLVDGHSITATIVSDDWESSSVRECCNMEERLDLMARRTSITIRDVPTLRPLPPQELLGKEFSDVLYANLDDLYEK